MARSISLNKVQNISFLGDYRNDLAAKRAMKVFAI